MSTHRGIKKEGVVRVIYSGLSLSHKKERNTTICSIMDGPREIVRLSEVSLTEKDKYLMTSLICGTFKKKNHGTNEPISKTEIEPQM